MEQVPELSRYRNMLERWMQGARPYLYTCPDRPELACYGSGDNHWGVQTNQKAFAAFAMLAADPGFDAGRAGMSREEAQDTALRLLRFSMQSHVSGDYGCTDGTSWGHTWISGLGVERMMHGVEALGPELNGGDWAQLRRVLLSECDWLLDHYEIVAGLYAREGRNKPESNLWNGSLLYRTAMLYPDCPRAQEYVEKAERFLVNALSIPSDADSGVRYDGRQVAELHAGANFFDSFALNHHGYLNVGYMAICLSNTAILHFICKDKGWKAPESLYHHVKELWDLLKALTFPDGRLLRIGGDTRVRYAYCQDYALPAWLLAQDLYGDREACRMEAEWYGQMLQEMNTGEDGSFFPIRCRSLAEQSPLYYARLEADRAVSLSMVMAWRGLIGKASAAGPASPSTERIEPRSAWHDAYHGAYLSRSPSRIASWVWESAEKPQGLCLPPDASGLAEWRENMAGRIEGLGKVSGQRLLGHGGGMLEGGFLTWGVTTVYTQGLLTEGRSEEDIAENRIVCAALPDDTHMVVLQRASALNRRIHTRSVKGLHLLLPNDVLNRTPRIYYYQDGHTSPQGPGVSEETIRLGSRWINADDRIGVIAAYGADSLSVHRPAVRQIGLKRTLKHHEEEGTLYADEICGDCVVGLRSHDPGRVLWDAGYVVQSGRDHRYTESYAAGTAIASMAGEADSLLRRVRIRGADGGEYLVAANFGSEEAAFRLSAGQEPWDLLANAAIPAVSEGGEESGDGSRYTYHLAVPAGEGRVYRLG